MHNKNSVTNLTVDLKQNQFIEINFGEIKLELLKKSGNSAKIKITLPKDMKINHVKD